MSAVNGLIAGVVVGGAYALMAVGVVLIFSTTGVLNFAHAGFAMVAAYMYAWLATNVGAPVGLAALAAVATGATLGAVVELGVMRRVRDSSVLIRVIATLGVLMLLQGLVLLGFGFGPRSAPSMFPAGLISLGRFGVTVQQAVVLVAAVVLMIALGIFLRLTRTGLAIRAAAQDTEVAQLMGISRGRVAVLNWTLAAFLAAVAGVLIAPLTIITVGTFPLLLIQSLIAAMLGGATSLLGGVVGGLAVGGVQGLATAMSSVPGARELFLLVLIALALVWRRRWRDELADLGPPTTGQLTFRFSGTARASVVLAIVALLVAAMTSDLWAFIGALALVHVLVLLSLVVMTGWSGQVSLLHGSLVGVGAFAVTWSMGSMGVDFAPALVVAGVLGGTAGALISLPSLRLQGLHFGVVTLVISAAMSGWLFETSFARRTVARPEWLASDRAIFGALLLVVGLAFLAARNVRTGLWGGRLFAVRQSAPAAAHLGVDVLRTRVAAASFSGVLAGMAGGFYAILLTAINPDQFGPIFSITLLLFAVVGGIESMAGPVLAALVFVAGPEVVRVSQESANALPDILSGLLVLLLLAARPQGLATFLRRPAVARSRAPTRVAEGPRRLRRMAIGSLSTGGSD